MTWICKGRESSHLVFYLFPPDIKPTVNVSKYSRPLKRPLYLNSLILPVSLKSLVFVGPQVDTISAVVTLSIEKSISFVGVCVWSLSVSFEMKF